MARLTATQPTYRSKLHCNKSSPQIPATKDTCKRQQAFNSKASFTHLYIEANKTIAQPPPKPCFLTTQTHHPLHLTTYPAPPVQTSQRLPDLQSSSRIPYTTANSVLPIFIRRNAFRFVDAILVHTTEPGPESDPGKETRKEKEEI